MKAYRAIPGGYKEIDVDVDHVTLQPILPPDTTTDPKPETVTEGHYLTVVGTEWVEIEIPVPVFSFEYLKQKKLEKVSEYRDWLFSQPVEHAGVLFDADDTARTRLTQALVMTNPPISYVPPVWVTYDNGSFPINDLSDLVGIVAAVTSAFSQRFYDAGALRGQVMAAEDQAALDTIEIPAIPEQGL